MLSRIMLLLLLLEASFCSQEDGVDNFVYNDGFTGLNLTINGAAEITGNGLLKLTPTTALNQIGHAFFPTPMHFKRSDDGKMVVPSFSTTFVIAFVPQKKGSSGNGMAFVISPSKELVGSKPSQFLGLFNTSTNGIASNNITAVEFDTIRNEELLDINDNHVGINVNGLTSISSFPAGYYSDDNGGFQNISLEDGNRLQVWIEYSGATKNLTVTMASIKMKKPHRPLLSTTVDLTTLAFDSMYVGFSAATGTILTSHYVLGWSFKVNDQAEPLDISRLPRLPHLPKNRSKLILSGVAATLVIVLLLVVAGVSVAVIRRLKFREILEDWERQIGAHRILYKDLFMATKGFKDTEVIGVGGFGKVYKGILPVSKIQVAVKKVADNFEEGTRQFLAEISSLGRIRDRNFVELLGYCRRKGELLLVYEFMPNCSLDRFLYDQPRTTLNWSQRFKITKQVASGLFFLHERWIQTVLHRDIKASNVLLDSEFNGKLGDFGLSRLYDHGSDPQTTRLVGTVGYMAPELNRTGKATKGTDVYAFGIFLLEVVGGRRPMDVRAEKLVLVEWVSECFRDGRILAVVDPKLGTRFQAAEREEIELVLKLGLLCSLDSEAERPTMGQVMRYLNRDCPLPEVPLDGLRTTVSTQTSRREGSQNLFMSSASLHSVSVLVSGR
ncbi:L-type lectin-domain containing receptor kinase SIT2-like [Aristolochia californica]|uniref:L-type lectin-domain containing receptor kinase SIT2-like n=1 Tax=Aristolochia californica TaxID=171875 RepID=UPI0035D6E110